MQKDAMIVNNFQLQVLTKLCIYVKDMVFKNGLLLTTWNICFAQAYFN